MSQYQLKEGEYWGHEVYLVKAENTPPQPVHDLLKAHGFRKTDDDSYFIPRESLEFFKTLVVPHKVGFLQTNCLCGGVVTMEDWDRMLDLVNALKAAGVKGIENFCDKLRNLR